MSLPELLSLRPPYSSQTCLMMMTHAKYEEGQMKNKAKDSDNVCNF